MSDMSAGAPLGAVAVDTSGSNSASSNPNPSTTQTTSGTQPQQVSADPVEINPDGLYKIPGVEKPVKFSDHVRGFQAQATRASQRAAELERKLQEAERRAQQYEQTQRQNPNGQPNQVNPFQEMASKPYLTGEELAGAFQSLGQEINYRDQITIAILQKLKTLEGALKPVYETTQNQAFSGKISGWLQQGGYGDEWKTVAEGLYLEYEPGPELDQAFPQLLQERISQIEANLEKRRRAAAEQARRAPFVPGKGGAATPSRPFQPDPSRSARAEADAIWDAIQIGPGT